MLANVCLERDEVGASRVAVCVQEIMRRARRESAFVQDFDHLAQSVK